MVVLNGNKIDEYYLEKAYNSYNTLAELKNPSHISKEFDSVIPEVVKYFLNRTRKYNNKIEYTLFNPSIADFILYRYGDNEVKLGIYFNALNTIESLNELSSLRRSNKIKKTTYKNILLQLLSNSYNNEDDVNYLLRLYLKCESVKNEINFDINKISQLIQTIIQDRKSIYLISEFHDAIFIVEETEFIIEDYTFFSNLIFNTNQSVDDVNSIIELYKHFRIDDEIITDEINELITRYIEYELEDRMNNISEFEVEFEEEVKYSKDGQEVIYYVKPGMLEDLLNDYFRDIVADIIYFNELSIDENCIKDTVNIDEIDDYLTSQYNPYEYYDDEDRGNYSNNYYTDDIDSLFERT